MTGLRLVIFLNFFFIIGVLFREWVEADVLIREGAAGYERDRTLRQPPWSWRETGFRKHTYWQEHNMHTCVELGQRGRDCRFFHIRHNI